MAEDRAVYALNGATGELLWKAVLPNVADTVAVYGAQKARVLAGTRDSQVHLFNTDGSELWRAQLKNAVTGVAAVGNGAKVVATTIAGDVVMLNGANTQVLWTAAPGEKLRDVAITADGSLVLTGDAGGTLYMLDGKAGALQQSQAVGSPIEAVALSPDGRFFMTGTKDGEATFGAVAAAASQFADAAKHAAWAMDRHPAHRRRAADRFRLLGAQDDGRQALLDRACGQAPSACHRDVAPSDFVLLSAPDARAAVDLQLLSRGFGALSRLYRVEAGHRDPLGRLATLRDDFA